MAGLLSTPPEGATDENVNLEEGGDDEQEQQAAPEPAPKPERVPLPPKEGRRARAAQAQESLAKEVESLKERFTKDSDELRRQLSERDQMIAQLRGGIEAMQRMGPQQQQQQSSPQAELERLEREAKEYMDRGDLTEYRKRERQIAVLEAEQRLAEKYKLGQQPAQQPATAGLPPEAQIEIMSQFSRFPKLAENPEKTLRAVSRKISELIEDDGFPNTPATRAKAWEIVAQKQTGRQEAPQFSQQYKEALYGVPAGRANGHGKGEPQVRLPPGWQRWADAAGMDRNEYVKIYAQEHPEAVEE